MNRGKKIGPRSYREEMRKAEHLAELVHDAFESIRECIRNPGEASTTASIEATTAVWESIYGTSTVPARYVDPKVAVIEHEACQACGAPVSG